MFNQFGNWFLLAEKIFAISGTILYFIFSVVVVKQVSTMTKNIKDKFNGVLIAFSYLHLLFALLLIFVSLFL